MTTLAGLAVATILAAAPPKPMPSATATPAARCESVTVQGGRETPVVTCIDLATPPSITLHDTAGGPVLDRLALTLGKTEWPDATSLKLHERAVAGIGFLEIHEITKDSVTAKRAIVFEVDPAAKKLSIAWTSPACSATCVQDFSLWIPSDNNQWVDFSYVQLPRVAPAKKDLVKVQRFRARQGHLAPFGALQSVTFGTWFSTGVVCKDGNPLCAPAD